MTAAVSKAFGTDSGGARVGARRAAKHAGGARLTAHGRGRRVAERACGVGRVRGHRVLCALPAGAGTGGARLSCVDHSQRAARGGNVLHLSLDQGKPVSHVLGAQFAI